MKRILSFGVLAGLGVLMGCPIYGDDSTTITGDCTTMGCSVGYTCTVENSVASCVANDGGTEQRQRVPILYSGCFADSDCTADGWYSGARCLAGTLGDVAGIQCTSASNQCADLTQCTNGEQCVQGACTPPCSGTKRLPRRLLVRPREQRLHHQPSRRVPFPAAPSGGR